MVHVVDRAAVANLPAAIRNSAFPITGDHFLAAVTTGEYDGVMMRVNHSCEPNVGMGGNVVLVSMRDIAVGEEVTIDYALFLGDPGFAMACRCGAAGCRAMVTGTDWMRPACSSATGDGFPGGCSRRSRRPGAARLQETAGEAERMHVESRCVIGFRLSRRARTRRSDRSRLA